LPARSTNLFTPEEVLDIYGVPILNDVERSEYFTLNNEENKAVKKFNNHNNAVYFLICLAFFKVKKTLVKFQYREVTQERRYVMRRYYPNLPSPKTLPQNKSTITRIENVVLKVCGYQRLTVTNLQIIKNGLQKMAPSKPKQRELLKALLALLDQHQIAIPVLTNLKEIVSDVWVREQNRLVNAYKRYSSKSQRAMILSLLAKTEDFHNITNIRQDLKGFRTQELQAEIEKHVKIKPIFIFASSILPKLSLPITTVEYYATLIHYYSGSRLKQINHLVSQLYLVCYCFSRYQMINDNLLDALKKRTMDYKASAKKYANEQALQQLDIANDIRKKVSTMLMAIRQSSGAKVSKRVLYKHLPANEWLTAAALLAEDKFDKEILFWQHVDNIEKSIKLSLRPILKVIDIIVINNNIFDSTIKYLKTSIAKGNFHKKPLPSHLKNWVPARYREYIFYDGNVIHNRFEFLLYMQIAHHMMTDKLSLKYTVKYKSIDDHCYQQHKWKKEKSTILRKLGQTKLKAPIDNTIKEKRRTIEKLYKEVNDSILKGNNDAIKVINHQDGSRSWKLRSLKSRFDESDSFFSYFSQQSIVDVLHFVNHKTNFAKAFTPTLPKATKREKDITLVVAVILANAIRLGSRKMASISDLNQPSLLTAEANYVRIETVTAAIDIINNSAAQLPIYKKWYINSALHGSFDGVKLESSRRNFKTRYSSKYFGQGVGVSAYNEVVNSFSIAGKLIGANEYEGHFAFEMVHHQNKPNIKPSNLSSDKHGTNSLNHALFDLTSYTFSPRYPKPHREPLWGFGSSKAYKNYIIKPTKFVNNNFIQNEWDNIQRWVASLLTGIANPSNLIRKISSKNYYSPTKKALVHYNQLVKTEYLLNYILNPELRRSVLNALNRGEGYNRLYRAITILNKGNLRGQSEIEMELWNHCTRLISSVVLYYNTYTLNHLYQSTKDPKEKNFLSSISPCAWGHINLMGYYQFNGKNKAKQIDKTIKNWGWQKHLNSVENQSEYFV